jgi:hypothetical protein
MAGGVEPALGLGDMAGGLHEGRKLLVGDLGAVHPETSHLDLAHRPLLGEDIVAHHEASTGHPQHVRAGAQAMQAWCCARRPAGEDAAEPGCRQGAEQQRQRSDGSPDLDAHVS